MNCVFLNGCLNLKKKVFKMKSAKNNDNILAILNEIKLIREENSYYKTVCAKLVEKTNLLEVEVNLLKGELNYMRQDVLRNNLIIQSVPKISKESVAQVIPTIATIFKINCESTDYSVNQIITKNKKHLLLVKFNVFEMKMKFMKAIKEYGLTTDQIGVSGTSKKIFFTNHLTFYNLNLIKQSKILKNEHAFEFVWFQSGVVLARKNVDSQIQRIKTLEDVNTIIKSSTTVITEAKPI